MLFPRIGHTDQSRPELHKLWRRALNGDDKGKPKWDTTFSFISLPNRMDVLSIFYVEFCRQTNGRTSDISLGCSKGQWASGVTPIDGPDSTRWISRIP